MTEIAKIAKQKKRAAFLDRDPIEENRRMQELQTKPHLMFLDLMIIQRAHDQAYVLAEASTGPGRRTNAKKEHGPHPDEGSRPFTISFYNHETRKTEVIEEKADVLMRKDPGQSVDEALGSGSMLPIYLFVGSPMIREEYPQHLLDRILSERDIDTPKPSGTGEAVPIVQSQERRDAQIEERRLEASAREAVIDAIIRKEAIESAVADEVIMLSEIVSLLRKGEDMEKAISRLPPLSRLRFALAIRKKRLGRQLVIGLLIGEITFLKGIKKRLQNLTPRNLINIMKLALSRKA